MKYKKRKRSTPRMGVVGGLTDMADNIALANGTIKRKKNPYEGGVGQAVENLFTGLASTNFNGSGSMF